MERNERFLDIAESLMPTLFTRQVGAAETVSFRKTEDGKFLQCSAEDYKNRKLNKGDQVCVDFGSHLVGKITLKFGYTGSHPDAPAWIRLKFAERPSELFENAENYRGWISTGWIQQEQIHIDVLPAVLELPRRYAFRYLQVEVLDVSSKYSLTLEDAVCTASTSADEKLLTSYTGSYPELDRVACNTLKSCMQQVFEDGPKRDRRLWIGDLRMQALANYETFHNDDLVKRCLYLFAGSAQPGGRVGACVFIEPEVEVDDTVMFDYSLFFNSTLLDYYKATGDLEALRDLAPTGWKQFELVQSHFDENHLVKDSDVLGWCFVDWNLNLNKQASAQGVYLYCLKSAMEIAQILGESEKYAWLKSDYAAKKTAAERLWDQEKLFFVSGDQKQISWASQVWMVLGGAVDEKSGAQLLSRLEAEANAEAMVTPYMYHNYVDALLAVGQRDKALEVLTTYWGGMVNEGADTFWELYNPSNPNESPYGGTIVNSFCHAWSCAPAYFLRHYFSK